VVEQLSAARAKVIGNLYPAAIEARKAVISTPGEGGDSSDEEEDDELPKHIVHMIERYDEILGAGHAAATEVVSRLEPASVSDPEDLGRALHTAWKAYVEEVLSETTRKHSDVDLKQKALKVFMNTFYGVAGNKTSPLFFMTVAGGTTTAGRKNIQAVARLVRGRGCTVHYGDSVTGDTIVFVRYDKDPYRVTACLMDDLFPDEASWKVREDSFGIEKELALPDDDVTTEVWSDSGWTELQGVVRHSVDKELFTVMTGRGAVTVTADHSLLTSDGVEISPRDIVAGETEILHHEVEVIPDSELSFEDYLPEVDCIVDNLVHMVKAHSSRPKGLFDISNVGDCWPLVRLHGVPNEYKEGLWRHFLDKINGAWAEYDPDREPTESIEIEYLPDTIYLHALNEIAKWGRHTLVWKPNSETGKTALWLVAESAAPNPALVQVVVPQKEDPLYEIGKTYVYDLTTDNHHFHVGPGDMVVHNTDSVYLSVPPDVFLLYVHAHSAWLNWRAQVKAAENAGIAPPPIPPAAYYAGRGTKAKAARKFFGAAELTDDQIAEADVETLKAWGFRPMDKERFWTKKVWATMRQLQVEQKAANDMLEAENGTNFLKLAYEEVLFPVVFTGKKKYFGIAHEGVPNFKPKKLFIRGIDVIKQGQTGLAKEIAFDVMWQAVSVDETREMRALVEERVHDAVARPEQWRFKDFVRTDTYKPDKQNIPVLTFVKRMKAKHARELAANQARVERGELPLALKYEPPAAADKFEYVVVLPRRTHTLSGIKITPGKGDMMEFASVVGAGEGVKALNLTYYMEKTVVGTCARLIGGDEIFAETNQNAETAKREDMGLLEMSDENLSLEDVKEITKAGDDAVFKEAKKHLMLIVKGASGEEVTIPATRLGAAYRAAGKNSISLFIDAAHKGLNDVGLALATAARDFGVTAEDADEREWVLEALRQTATVRASALEQALDPGARAEEIRNMLAYPHAAVWCDPALRIAKLKRSGDETLIAVAEQARQTRLKLREERDSIVRKTSTRLSELGASGVDVLDVASKAMEAFIEERRKTEIKLSQAKALKETALAAWRPQVAAATEELKQAENEGIPENIAAAKERKKHALAGRRGASHSANQMVKDLTESARRPMPAEEAVARLGQCGLDQQIYATLAEMLSALTQAELAIVRRDRLDAAVMEALSTTASGAGGAGRAPPPSPP
jgi:hypothetical protein